MASKLHQLRSKITAASEFASKHGCAYYKQLMEKNKKYVVEPPTVEKCNELSKQLFYTRLASSSNAVASNSPAIASEESDHGGIIFFCPKSQLAMETIEETCIDVVLRLPGRYESFWKELDAVKQIWKNRHELKVEDAGIAALFGLECYCWFCAGEIIGRGFTFTGYHV